MKSGSNRRTLTYIGIFVVLGVFFTFTILAADDSERVSFEAESGTRSDGIPIVKDDATASNGAYVEFGEADSCVHDDGYVNPIVGTCVGIPSGTQLSAYSVGQNPSDANKVITLSTDNEVIDSKRIYGCININARNVTIKNSYIECYRSRDIQNNNNGFDGAISNLYENGINTRITNNEIVCKIKSSAPGTAPCDFGINGSDMIAQYNNIYGAVDGFGVFRNADFSYNYIHDLTIVYEEYRSDYGHADMFQLYSSGSGNAKIIGNYMLGKQYENGVLQGILVQAPSSVQPKPDIQIKNNRLEDVFASLRITCRDGASCAIERNIIDSRYKSSNWVIELTNAHSSSYSRCNYFDDGSFIQNSNMRNGSTNNSNC